MKDLDGHYASFFNVRHRRVGHLFQGRFKGHLVDSEPYLLSLSRYIVLNPVRARMVETPGEWRWSSYRATAGLAAVPHWLDPGPILDAFNADDWNKAMHGYREFVAAAIGKDASPWENLVAGMFLGGNDRNPSGTQSSRWASSVAGPLLLARMRGCSSRCSPRGTPDRPALRLPVSSASRDGEHFT